MGAFGLQRFLQKDAPSECYKKVDVKELAAAYRDETGREPVLLVDGRNYLKSTSLCPFKTEELLLGGQMQEFINNMKHFVAAFKVIEDPNAFLANVKGGFTLVTLPRTQGGGLGGSISPPPKFRSFEKAGPNSQFRGMYICNNLIRKWV
jgi:hypothetical protein